jgi:L-seryl-tRNA(Ser) seleniumtransferase
MTYAALEATLRLYDRGIAEQEVPVIRSVAAPMAQIEERAIRFASLLSANSLFKTTLEQGQSVIGGGSAPGVYLPTVLVTIESSELSASTIESMLRSGELPVIARTERDCVVIDLRTVAPDEESRIIQAFELIAARAVDKPASCETESKVRGSG